MPSLIKGYEYDIFISYRQKDNKADKWVTHFVEALKDEIEATFKEDICIYFDENPHDGLLETHDVEQSLQEKIKVLVFIPIISQTYCDPNCFAWQKEFIAFRNFATEDELGLDIRLANGNVCKRILPVQIHEIDTADQALYEKEAGSVLRPVDFIYKDSGVNRPLRPNEEFPEENLNHSQYRNQINKVANAIKEIIGGIKGDDNNMPTKKVVDSQNLIQSSAKIYNLKSKTLWTAIALLLILFLSYIFINRESSNSNGIAVLTFSNFSMEEGNQYFAAGITEAVRNNLGQAAGLKVISRNSIEKFEKLNLSTPEMASELDVEYVLDGSVQKDVDNIRINVQLIDAKTDVQIWSEVYNRPYQDLLGIQSDIATDIVKKLNITTNPGRKKSLQVIENPDAYDLYLKGLALVQRPKGSLNELKNTLQIFDSVLVLEPSFAPAYLGQAQAYLNDMFYARSNIADIKDVTIDLIMKAMEIDNGISECYSSLGIIYYHDLKFSRAVEYFKKAIKLNPNNVEAYKWLAIISFLNDDLNNFNNYYNKAIAIDPLNIRLQVDRLTINLWASGSKDAELELKKIVKETGDDYAIFCLGMEYAVRGNYEDAITTLSNRQVSRAETNWLLGYVLGKNGETDKAMRSLNFNLQKREEKYVPAYLISIIYIGLGDIENALKWLEVEYQEGPSYLFLYGLKADPKLTPLEGNPRFEALLAKMPFTRIRN